MNGSQFENFIPKKVRQRQDKTGELSRKLYKQFQKENWSMYNVSALNNVFNLSIEELEIALRLSKISDADLLSILTLSKMSDETQKYLIQLQNLVSHPAEKLSKPDIKPISIPKPSKETLAKYSLPESAKEKIKKKEETKNFDPVGIAKKADSNNQLDSDNQSQHIQNDTNVSSDVNSLFNNLLDNPN